jgi:hypothetical protein
VLEKATSRWLAHLLAKHAAPAAAGGKPAHAGYDVPST